MQFSYVEVGPGIFRPIIPIWIKGPVRAILADGLLDTGADYTLLTPTLAGRLGVDLDGLKNTFTMKAATGQSLTCKRVSLILELIKGSERVSWKGEVAVGKVKKPHWGFKGFLEFFRAEFDGPKCLVSLIPGNDLPQP